MSISDRLFTLVILLGPSVGVIAGLKMVVSPEKWLERLRRLSNTRVGFYWVAIFSVLGPDKRGLSVRLLGISLLLGGLLFLWFAVTDLSAGTFRLAGSPRGYSFSDVLR